MMAEVEKKTATESAEKKTMSKAKNGSGAKAESAATHKKSAAAVKKRSGSKAARDGVELLRRAVNRRVGEKSEELADVLMQQALHGNPAATKAVVELADAKKPDPPKKRAGPSLVKQLEEESQWEGEGRVQGCESRD
jgi:hypothetical protein